MLLILTFLLTVTHRYLLIKLTYKCLINNKNLKLSHLFLFNIARAISTTPRESRVWFMIWRIVAHQTGLPGAQLHPWSRSLGA